MEQMKINKYITIILLISVIISNVSADSINTSDSANNNHSKKVSLRLENATSIYLSNQTYEVIGKDNTNEEIRSKGYTTTGAELQDVVVKINTSVDRNEYDNFINFLKQYGIKVKHQFNESGFITAKIPANKIDVIESNDIVERMDLEAKFFFATTVQPLQNTYDSWG